MKIDKRFLLLLVVASIAVFSSWECTAVKKQKPKKNYKVTSNPKIQSKNYSVDKKSTEKATIDGSNQKLEEFFKKISFLNPIHQYVSSFSFVLFVLAPFFFALDYFKFRLKFSGMIWFCLWGGFLTGVLTILSGFSSLSFKNGSEAITKHMIGGEFVFWLSSLTLGTMYLTRKWIYKKWLQLIIFILLFVNAFLVSYTFYLGNQI